ncbi:MAG: hypothetical protein ACXVLQ_16770 [Bacteriovorax sp.]
MKYKISVIAVLFIFSSCASKNDIKKEEKLADNSREISSLQEEINPLTKEEKRYFRELSNKVIKELKGISLGEFEVALKELFVTYNTDLDKKLLPTIIANFVTNTLATEKTSKDIRINSAIRVLLSLDENSKETAIFLARDLSTGYSYRGRSFPPILKIGDYYIDFEDEDLIKNLLKNTKEVFPFSQFGLQSQIALDNKVVLSALEEWAKDHPERKKQIAKVLAGNSHRETMPLWNKENLIPEYLIDYLPDPESSEFTESYYKRTGKKFVPKKVEVKAILSYWQQDLLDKPEKLTPKLVKRNVDDTLERLLDAKKRSAGPNFENDMVETLRIFLEHGVAKNRVKLEDNERLIAYLAGPNGKEIIEVIKDPRVLDLLEQYISKYYEQKYPNESHEIVSGIEEARKLLDERPINHVAKAARLAGHPKNCSEIALVLIKN